MPSLLINIDVPSLTQGEAFYTKVFELKVGRRFGTDGVELLGFGSPIYLLEKPEGSLPFAASDKPRSYVRHWTPVHIDVVVDNIDTTMNNAVAAGAKVESPISTTKWGKIALLVDPFGHGLCILQFIGRGYEEIST